MISDFRVRSDESAAPSVFQPPGVVLALLAGFAAGWTTWASSQEVARVAEPWNALLYYSTWLFAGGFVAGLIAPCYWYLGFVGAWAAQAAYFELVYRVALPPGEPIETSPYLAALLWGSVQPLLGGWLGALLAKALAGQETDDGDPLASS